MFGLDDRIATFSGGPSIRIVLAVAVLLGLRHATDPDHIAAVTTLVASGRERAAPRAGELGRPSTGRSGARNEQPRLRRVVRDCRLDPRAVPVLAPP
jgi:hypothetical protein